MSPDDKVVYLNHAKRSERGAIQKLYDDIRQLAVERLTALLRNALDQVDDALFERADRAPNNQSQDAFFGAMRLVRLRRREFEQAFRGEVDRMFGALWQRTSAVSRRAQLVPEDEDLALIDNDRLEESIAIDSMMGKARARNMIALSQLHMRLDYLLSHRQVDESNNPLDPQQIIHIFTATSSCLDLEIEPRLILYKLFDKHALAHLPGCTTRLTGC